jgi:hypothetical protein
MSFLRGIPALSSKRLFAQAGPRPVVLETVYGFDGKEPPHIVEQPVALAITMRSPNSWVSSLKYGVSPQPLHALENSMRGVWNWDPRTVVLSTIDPLSGSEKA